MAAPDFVNSMDGICKILTHKPAELPWLFPFVCLFSFKICLVFVGNLGYAMVRGRVLHDQCSLLHKVHVAHEVESVTELLHVSHHLLRRESGKRILKDSIEMAATDFRNVQDLLLRAFDCPFVLIAEDPVLRNMLFVSPLRRHKILLIAGCFPNLL
ncbi:hypothetical protein MPH_11542 [Macrophomina phaseolina MS6]|uniref:Uncharacterized protein n=1 Tax=Macrophomina phaseolina (strain MS6) TaxID=1126212 RepID=K2QN67_MACPH|nr:hypothetical protein MPH_11542 [Macrophomina phaseolina MS6]